MAYYKKPKDVRYVDMCIWIDTNAYREDLTIDEKNQLFEYLYHLAVMLAAKEKYFKYNKDYENFGIYFASKVYFRYINPRQFKYDSEGNPKLEPLKSCLNFMKKLLYPAKVDYQQEYYAQNLDKENSKISYEYTVRDIITNSMNDLAYCDFELYLLTSDKTIKNFLKHIPHKGNKVEWNNIYISCLLTFLNSITLRDKSLMNKELLMNRAYDKQFDSSIVLWHLPDHMESYIQILVNEIKHLMAQDLSSTLHTYVSTNSNLDLLALSQLAGIENNEIYED